jgi:hypothetical protein
MIKTDGRPTIAWAPRPKKTKRPPEDDRAQTIRRALRELARQSSGGGKHA